MKTIVKLIAVITAVFILAAFISYRVITNYYNREEGMRTVVMNRITSDVEDRLEENCELSPDMIPDLDIYRQEYVKKAIPDEIRIVSINAAPHRIDADASYIYSSWVSHYDKALQQAFRISGKDSKGKNRYRNSGVEAEALWKICLGNEYAEG